MIQLFTMAFRDLGRNRRRSFFSALALGMGLALLLLMAGVVNGEYRGSMETSIKLDSGNLQVRAKTYNPDKTSLAWKDLLEDPGTLTNQIAASPLVAVATPRLIASGIVANGNQSLGVRILGIDTASSANEPFQQGLLSGQFLTANDSGGILMGQTLADKLKLKSGDSINLLVNTSNGDVDQQAFTIRGIFTTHTPSYDQSTLLMPLAKAQAITQAGNHASVIFILLKDSDQTNAVAASLQANSSSYQIMTFDQMNPLVTQTEGMSKAYMSFLYLIVLAITATVIVNTLIMSVFERTREIGILAAIGMKSSRIMAMFFAESGMLAIGGIIMGLAAGGLLVLYATHYGFFIGNLGITGMLIGERIYAYLTVNDAVTLTILAFIISLLAALYPAIMAARMEPVEALRGAK